MEKKNMEEKQISPLFFFNETSQLRADFSS